VTDLAIIGAGPAGLLAATRCAEAGLDVVVLEEHERIGQPTHCTGIISLETANLVKIVDDIVLNRLTRARLCGPGGAVCEIEWQAGAGEQIVVVDREQFDRGLAERAVSAGAMVRTGARVDDLRVDATGVSLGVAGHTLRARACLLACGVTYRFQRQLGLGLPGQVIHTAQIEVDAEPAAMVELHLGRAIAPEGFLWTVPVIREGRDRLKVGVMARGDAAGCLEAFVQRPDVRARLRGAPSPPVKRLLPLRPISRTYGERLLVAGDAAGFTKPMTGGGIFYSLVTASLAAETLIEAFQAGRLDGRFLARYQSRWQALLGRELSMAGWLRRRLAGASDAELDAVVDALRSDDIQALVRRTARFNWHREVIVALWRQRGLRSLLFRSLFR
jgi:geranylgeranyl reductase family protein